MVLQAEQNRNIDAQEYYQIGLRELRLELLRGCPLLCAHCSASAAPNHPMRLPVAKVLTLLDEFVDLGGQRVTFTGGEPFAYPELQTVLARAKQLKLEVRVFTSGVIDKNGQRQSLDVAYLEELAPFAESLVFSIYATESPLHDSITRIQGSLSLTIESIRRTVSAGIRAVIHFVPTMSNYQALQEVMALAASLGVQKVQLLRFVPHGRGMNKRGTLELDKIAYSWLRKSIITLREQYPSVILQVGSAFNALKVGESSPCTAGVDQLVVEADGRIAPCSGFGNFRMDDPFSNILDHSLQVIWHQSTYLRQVRQALQSSSQKTCGDCQGCLAQKSLVAGHIDPWSRDPLAVQLEYALNDANEGMAVPSAG